ncbi:MAG: hypothetical protein ACJAUH_002292 [Saprospiraceae bacterium]|jgi:hypothetical protein
MKKPKYNFYLNPHDIYKWTKCPKCENKTKVRKHCLMIHYKDKKKNFNQLISLNKSCKFCPYCELIIAQKSEIEIYINQIITNIGLKFNPNNYFVFGTMDRNDWKKSQKEPLNQGKAFDFVAPFKDTWDFEIQPAGWYYEGK